MNETEEIKSRLPIEQVVASYIPLKKAGRIYKACCPFHNEKTPSFTVSPDRGIYKCFGCGEGGDIFDFVMKIDSLSFHEALEMLAEKAGVELTKREPARPLAPGTVSKERLLKVNAYTAKLWHTILQKHPKAESARDYLKSRGLTSITIDTFQIGYAPHGAPTQTALKEAGFSSSEINQAGDPTKFQDRITFPIWDVTGKIVGFTGRLLELPDDPKPASSRGPKYWNTPETALFIKSRTLYGLHLAKRAIQDEDLSLLVEGQMDVITLHQGGFANAVASSGTALTPDQVRLLGRFSHNICFAYDQDRAGIEATKRGIELVLQSEFNPYVIVMPSGKDPAECLQKDPEVWQKAYEHRLPFFEWLTDRELAENKELNPVRKKEVVQTLLPWLARIPDALEQSEWVRWLAVRLQTDEKNIQTALDRLDQKSAPKPPTEAPSSPNSTPHSFNKSELAVALLLSFPAIFSAVKNELTSLQSNTPFLQKLVPLLQQAPVDSKLTDHLRQQLSEAEQKNVALYCSELLRNLEQEDIDDIRALEEFMLLTQRIRSEAKEEAKTRLAGQIRAAQQAKDQVELQRLFSELKNLI